MFGKKEVVMKCPHCDTIVSGSTYWLKKKMTCQNCGKDIDTASDSLEVVTCHSCGNHVMFDTRKGALNVCPTCNASLVDNMMALADVTCPNCHITQKARKDESMHTCPICDNVFDVKKAIAIKEAEMTSTASVITIPAGNTDIIWKHPQTVFPYASQVIVPEGYTALLLVNGRCSAPSEPGNYLLSDSLNTQQETLQMAVLDPSKQISVEILFVKKEIDKTVAWGGIPVKVTEMDGSTIGELGFGGTVAVRIVNAKAFAEFVGYKRVTIEELLPDGQYAQSSFLNEIKNQCYKAANGAIILAATQMRDTAAKDNRIISMEDAYKQTSVNKLSYETDVRAKSDERLAEIGIRTRNFSLDFIELEESDELKAKRAEAEAEKEAKRAEEEKIKENTEKICGFIERPFNWESSKVSIHMKGNPILSTEIVMGGRIKLRIENKERFFEQTETQEWIKYGVEQSQVSDYFAGLTHDASVNPLNEILQPMIDETDADVRDLKGYYTYIRRNIQESVEDSFVEYGLDVAKFTLEEKSRFDSDSLKGMTGVAKHKADYQIKQEMEMFDRKMKVLNARDESQTRQDVDDIELGEEKHLHENDKVRTGLGVDDYATKAWAEQEKEKTDHETRTVKNEIGHKEYESEEAWKHQQELKKRERGAELSRLDQRDKLQHIYDEKDVASALHFMNQQEIENRASELRARWENESRLEADQLRHQLEMAEQQWQANRKKTLGQVDLQHMVEQSSAENDRIINSILRKIAESDLELTQKKDTYERVLGNQQADDELRHWINENEAKIDMTYKGGHIDNILTQEEQDYIQVLRDRESARSESITNANFAREMRRKQFDTEHEMEMLKMQFDYEDKQDRMQHELDLKDREIEILELQLNALGRAGDQDVAKVGIQSDAETARAIAENEYRIKHEEEERRAREKREQDLLDRDERYSKRADELLSQMMAIQKALKVMGLENEKTFIQESADVDKVRAMAHSKLQNDEMLDLMEDMKKIAQKINKKVDGLEKDIDKLKHKKTPNTIYKKSSGFVMSASDSCRKCPHCGAVIPSKHDTFCSSCFEPLN